MNAPFVEMVGFEKVNKRQSEFAKLRTISVRGLNVANGGDDIGDYVDSLTMLDIAENCVESWDVMASMAKSMKKLSTLNVDNNRMSLPTSPPLMREAFGEKLQVNVILRQIE